MKVAMLVMEMSERIPAQGEAAIKSPSFSGRAYEALKEAATLTTWMQ